MRECVVRMKEPKNCWGCPCGKNSWIWGDDGKEKMACFCGVDSNSEVDGHYILETDIEPKRPSWCPIIAVSPWHRCEDELPPKGTWVLTVATDGNVKLFNIATLDAGGQWWTCSPENILGELYGVRYWMHIEPPKEDA